MFDAMTIYLLHMNYYNKFLLHGFRVKYFRFYNILQKEDFLLFWIQLFSKVGFFSVDVQYILKEQEMLMLNYAEEIY